MECLRLGRVSYINCLPLFYAIETGQVVLPAKIVADHPAVLNRAFQQGELAVTAISSLAYGNLMEEALVLPGLSISCHGPVGSVLLASRLPVEELTGCRVSLTPYSATSVVLLRILMERFYHVSPCFFTRPAGTIPGWEMPDAVLTIGDEALQLAQKGSYPFIYDLGAEWKKFTGKPMVFALWAVRREFAAVCPEGLLSMWKALQSAKDWGRKHPRTLAAVGAQRLGLAPDFMEKYFALLNYDLDWLHLEGLLTFYRLAYDMGLLPLPTVLDVWGKENEGHYRLQSAGR